MKRILGISLLQVLALWIVNSHADMQEVIDYLFSNKGHLSCIAQPIEKKMGPKVVRSFGNDQRIITRYVAENKSSWEANKDTVLHAFLGLCIVNMSHDPLGNKLIRDTSLIKGIVFTLNCGNSFLEKDAYSLLLDYAPYPYLQKYNSDIVTRIVSSNLKVKDKNILITLCNPPPMVCKTLLVDSTIPLPLRARIGDKKAEKKILASLAETENTFQSFDDILKELFVCGSKKCLATTLFWFNKPVYRIGKLNCIVGSLRESIIYGLQRYFPEEPLLNEKFAYFQKKSNVIQIDEPNYVPDPEVKKYLEDVVAWGNKEFGVIPEGEIGEPILFKGPCDTLYEGK